MSMIKAQGRPAIAPGGQIGIGAPVLVRRAPGEPEFHARVVGRTIGLPLFDVETADGEVIRCLTQVRLDNNALAIRRAIDALDGGQGLVFARIRKTVPKLHGNALPASGNDEKNR